jgi:hypothetical protein
VVSEATNNILRDKSNKKEPLRLSDPCSILVYKLSLFHYDCQMKPSKLDYSSIPKLLAYSAWQWARRCSLLNQKSMAEKGSNLLLTI